MFSLATVEETNCPTGTIRETEGGASVDDCLPCPAGDYCLEGSYETSGGCEVAFYCPSPIINPYGDIPPYIGSYGPRQVSLLFMSNMYIKQQNNKIAEL